MKQNTQRKPLTQSHLPTRKPKVLELLDPTKIAVDMPQKVLDQIQYLCRKINTIEWSGVLFYSVAGTIKDPENMIVTLEDILPMDKGSSSYTEYTFDETVVEYMIENETFEKGWKVGHIHSHHNMGVFFSVTDQEELQDNSFNHNFYLSLIVNNKNDFCAKIGQIMQPSTAKEHQVPYFSKDEDGVEYSTKSSPVKLNPILRVYECDIHSPESEVQLPKSFTEKIEQLLRKPNPILGSRSSKNQGLQNWGGQSFPPIGKSKNKLAEDEFFSKKKDEIDESLDIEDFTLYFLTRGLYDSDYIDDALEAIVKEDIPSMNREFMGYFDAYFGEDTLPIDFEIIKKEVISEIESQASIYPRLSMKVSLIVKGLNMIKKLKL